MYDKFNNRNIYKKLVQALEALLCYSDYFWRFLFHRFQVEHDPGASRHIQNINALKDAARQAFEERMKESRAKMEENINFMQRRIL